MPCSDFSSHLFTTLHFRLSSAQIFGWRLGSFGSLPKSFGNIPAAAQSFRQPAEHFGQLPEPLSPRGGLPEICGGLPKNLGSCRFAAEKFRQPAETFALPAEIVWDSSLKRADVLGPVKRAVF